VSWGLFVHVKLPGQKKPSKSVLLYHEAPRASYIDYGTLNGERTFQTKMLATEKSSMFSRLRRSTSVACCTRTARTTPTWLFAARAKKATGAFASLKHCLFKRKDVTNEAKVAVYN
jgi:hypothetical protein